MNQNKRLHPLLALSAGALLPLAFAPLGWYPLAILCPAVLLYCWLQNPQPKRAFFLGWLFGLGQFGVGVSWVYVSIHLYGEAPPWLAAGLSALFIAVLALYPALQGYLFQRLFPRNTLSKQLLAFPALWVGIEWLRSVLFSGFPWLLLGHSQSNSPFRAVAPILGIYGIAFILTLLSALLVTLLTRRNRKARLLFGLSCILITSLSAGLNLISWTTDSGKTLSASLIQGDIPRSLKWSQENFDNSLATYQRLTDKHWQSDLIIWPESAIAMPNNMMHEYLDAQNDLARAHKTTLITGIPFVDENSEEFYNGMVALGSGQGHYFKQHLVPFGEYIPLHDWLAKLLALFQLPAPDNLSAGSPQQALIKSQGIKLATFICYEIAFSHIVRRDFPSAELIVTISDDMWFGHSLAPYQHLQIAQLQSLQTGRYQLTATNNGITAIIDDHGQITRSLPLFRQGVLTGNVTLKQGATPWVYWGNAPIFIILLMNLLVARIQSATREKSWPWQCPQGGMGDTL